MRYGMLLDPNKCVGCGACVIACKKSHLTPPNIYWSNIITTEEGTYPNAKVLFTQTQCMHCEDAPCVTNCPTGASYHDEHGRVQIDADRCIGCRTCINACPYGARHFNHQDPEEYSYWETGGKMPFEKYNQTKHVKGTVSKCVMCNDRVDEGLLPECVQACITESRIFGNLDDPQSKITREITRLNAKPMKEELGTKPSLFFVPRKV
ncbi:MAG: molybdopterin-containing oxidoreductase family iron-sulfur binding subunit [Sulfurimonas sp.]|jgi:molybdopterin-containing oxidoreductase family iron-sulfur binding subunit